MSQIYDLAMFSCIFAVIYLIVCFNCFFLTLIRKLKKKDTKFLVNSATCAYLENKELYIIDEESVRIIQKFMIDNNRHINIDDFMRIVSMDELHEDDS